MTGGLSVSRAADVWTVTLDRPDKRNALSADMVESLLDVVQQAPEEGAKVLVLQGAGKNFSAGFDLSQAESQSEGDLLLRFVRVEMLLQAVASSPCLTIACANGRSFGAGVDLIAACRLRVAAADATFRMPGLKFGLVLGSRRFADIVGADQAASLLEEVATFDACHALAIRFLHEIAEREQWASVIDRARARVGVLPDWSRRALYQALASDHADTDLAWLVRSAARPGLKQRVAQYLQSS